MQRRSQLGVGVAAGAAMIAWGLVLTLADPRAEPSAPAPVTIGGFAADPWASDAPVFPRHEVDPTDLAEPECPPGHDERTGPATPAPAPSETAVRRGIQWLVRHQSPDGSWGCDVFTYHCARDRCDGAGSTTDYTPGTTGLALLAFLGAGHSMRHGKYKEIVKRGLKYLISIQTPDGCIGPKVADGRYIYNHAIGTMALAEAYGLSGLMPSLKRPAQKAVDFLMSAQNPYLGWRYGIRPGDNDTSVTAWAVLALKSALLSDLNVPPDGFMGAKNWIDTVTDREFHQSGYRQLGDYCGTMCFPYRGSVVPVAYSPTAAALACRIFTGASRVEAVVAGGAMLLNSAPPTWNPASERDFSHWHFGSLAMFHIGGATWRAWNAALKDALLKSQRAGGCADGSWDPVDAWGRVGGRVYATAINTLTLETYYRHGRWLGPR